MLTVTLKWANKCFKKMLEPAPGANFFFENEEKLIFSLSKSKTILNEEKNYFEFSFWRVLNNVKGRYLKIFTKIFILRSL